MPLKSAATDDAQYFVRLLRPTLCTGDMQGTLSVVREHFTVTDLVEFLANPCRDVRQVAALALALSGSLVAVAALATALHDSDDQVVALAEQAMWSIWFRSGRGAAPAVLACGCNHVTHRNLETAIEKFSWAISLDSHFAEAYNQRAIAYFLDERYDQSIADCRAALARVPHHFGAMAGMGHGYAQLGRYCEARQCYIDALRIHPRLDGIQTSLAQVNQLSACAAQPVAISTLF